jgi:Caspase domain/Tetratricopeptide repeat
MPFTSPQIDDASDEAHRGQRATRSCARAVLDRIAQTLTYLLFVCALSATITSSGIRTAAAGTRLALVIGNAAYPDAETPLKGSVAQAKLVAGELRQNDFEVELALNLSKEAMRASLDRFYAKIQPDSTALLFFSGFAIQSDRQSYLLPVDARIWAETHVRRDGFSLDAVLTEMNGRGAKVKIAILDASRRNPYERRFRAVAAGLAPPSATRDTAVMFSAEPGLVIKDNSSQLFAPQLLQQMVRPVRIEDVFIGTRDAVSRESHSEQVPWFSSSLIEQFVLAEPAVATNEKPTTPRRTSANETSNKNASPADLEQQSFAMAEREVTAEAWKSFLAKHPDGPHADLAHERLARAEAPEILGLDERIERDTADARAYYRRGQLLVLHGAFKAAIKDFHEVIQLKPKDAAAYNNRCWARAIIGELQDALTDCNQALAIRPHYLDAFDSRGLINLKIDQPADAIADYNAALRINPKHVSSLYGRGIAKVRTGNVEAGNSDIAAARALQPDIAEEFAGYGVQ